MKKIIFAVTVLTFFLFPKSAWANYYNLVSPTNGSTTSSLTPTFSWTTDNPYSGGSGYTCVNICAGSDTACNTPITGVCANPGATSATYTGSSLQSNTQYRWLAYGYSGTTYWATSTSIWTFTTPIAQTAPVADYTMIEGATGCTYNNTNLDNGLISHWDMDQKGPVIPDTKSNNNGTVIGTTLVSGLSGNARGFNGGSDKIILATPPSVTNGISISAWVYFNSNNFSNFQEIFNDNQFFLRKDSGGEGNHFSLFVKLSDGSIEPRAQSSLSASANTWYHVVGTWNGTTAKIYVNGTPQGQSTRSGSLISTTAQAQLGMGEQTNLTANSLNGTLDEVSVWNRALSDSAPNNEIATLYNSGVPTTCGPAKIIPDDATTYTLTVATEDNNGGADITQQQAIINLNGASRGLIGWQSSDAANIWGAGNITYFSDHHCALYTAGGATYAYGNEFLDVAGSGCSSVATGTQRVTTFSLKFKQNFFSPVANTLSQNAYDSVSNTTNWATGNSFNIAPQACVVPTGSTNFAYSSGLVDWWNLDEGSGFLNADLLGANDLLAKNSLYQSLAGWWKMDSDTTDATGQNSSSTAGSLGCNFKVGGSYDNALPANLLSYWKLDEPPPSPTCDFSYLNSSLASGKVSYWTMNEGAGGPEALWTVDQWNGYNGTFTGTTATPGKVGYARNFANTYNDYITVADQPALRLNASTGWSASAWIYPTSYTSPYNEIIDKDQNYIMRLQNNGTVTCYLYINGNFNGVVTSTGTAPLNTWTYSTCTWDGANLKVYLNAGTPVSVPAAGTVSNGTPALWIGAAFYGSTFKGKIDEVTIWNKPLSATEVGLLYNSGNGVACQVPSPNYADAMGLNPGIPGSGANLTPTTGKINNAQSFNGTSDYLSIGGPNLSTAFALPYTFATWVKFNAVNKGTDNAILGQGEATTDKGLHIGERGGKLYFGFYNDDLAGTTTLSANTWYHVAFVFDRWNLTKQIYLNGNLDASGPTNRYFSTLTNAQLGQYPWATNNKLNGVLDEAAFWITPLSATQIGYLASPPTSCDAGPVAVPGKVAVGMAFGSNDGVTTPHLDLSTGFTAAAWVKPRDVYHNYNSDYQIFLAQENNFLLGMSKTYNRVTAQVNVGGAWLGGFELSGALLPLNQWTYLVMAWDKNNIYVYLNGILYSQYPAAGNLTASSANLYFGKRPDYTTQRQTYNGYLDDVAIWKRALSGAEIATLYNNEVAGQTYVPNTNSGPTIISPGATNPTQTNLTNYPPLTNVPPTTSHAKSFNGGGDYLVNASPIGLPTGSTMTVSAWVKPTGTYADPSYNGVVSFGPRTSNNSFLLALQNSGKPTFAAWGNDFVPTGGSVITVTPNQWNHLAAVLSGSSVTLYVNGQTNNQMTGTLGSVPSVASGPLVIGATDYNPPGRFFNGAIDEVRIYNRALSATEVSDEYNRYQRDSSKAISPTCGGTCGQYVQNFIDPYCVSINQSCQALNYAQITGNIMNAPSGASLTVSANGPPNLTASSANNQITVQNGVTTYSFSQNNTPQNGALKSTTYVMNAGAISGYSVNPNNYQLDVACTDVTGPTFWYDSDAGMTNQTFAPVGSDWYNGGAGGKISQSGNPPGYHLDGYQDVTPISKVTFNELLGQTNKNSGLGANNPCTSASPGPGVQNFTAGSTVYQYWCYNESTYPFESRLRTATTTPYGTPNVIVLYPDPGVATWTLKQITGSTFAVPASRTILAFVPASLEIQQKVTVAASSGLVMVLKATSTTNPDLAGNLYIDNTVGCASTGVNCTIASEGSALDGVYVFPGFFTDTYSGGSSNRKLIGQGSLIGTGTSSLGLNRTLGATTGPGEEWHFQSKYLKMYQNILSGPRYSWKELPPQ